MSLFKRIKNLYDLSEYKVEKTGNLSETKLIREAPKKQVLAKIVNLEEVDVFKEEIKDEAGQ